MKDFTVVISLQAFEDIEDITSYREKQLLLPLSSENFYIGIIKNIRQLKQDALLYPVSKRESLFRYAVNVRRFNYKGFAIIYSIENSKVIVHRITHGSLII